MRTYYVLEMCFPRYPVHELYVTDRKPSDSTTAANAYRVRASTKAEAEKIVRDKLNTERLAACQEQLS